MSKNRAKDNNILSSEDYQKAIKLGIYMTLKNLYDKWVSTYDEGKFILKSPADENRLYKRRSGELSDNSSVSINDKTYDRYLEVDSDFSNFMFVDSFFNDISTKFLCNPEIMYNIIMDQVNGETNYTMYNAMANFANSNQLLFRAFPMFNNFYRSQGIVETFTPYPLIDKYTCDESTYVCMYTGELSKNTTISGGKTDDFKADCFDIVDMDGSLNADTITNLFKKNTYTEMPTEGTVKVNQEKGLRNIIVPAFGVTYALQNQSYFKNIQVNMDSPKVTDYSIKNMFQLAKINPVGELVTPHTIAQDAYTIFSNHSYNCTVEMLGDMQIMPLMFFQLRNIPLFKGAYQIIDVEHSIKGGLMTTKFTGVRMSKYVMPFVDDVFSKKEKIEAMLRDSVATEYGRTIVGKNGVAKNTKAWDGSDTEESIKKYFDFSRKVSTSSNAENYFKLCIISKMFNPTGKEVSHTVLENTAWKYFRNWIPENFTFKHLETINFIGWKSLGQVSIPDWSKTARPGDLLLYMNDEKAVYNVAMVVNTSEGFALRGLTGNGKIDEYKSNDYDGVLAELYRFNEGILYSYASQEFSLGSLLTPEKTEEEKKEEAEEGKKTETKSTDSKLDKDAPAGTKSRADSTKTIKGKGEYKIARYYSEEDGKGKLLKTIVTGPDGKKLSDTEAQKILNYKDSPVETNETYKKAVKIVSNVVKNGNAAAKKYKEFLESYAKNKYNDTGLEDATIYMYKDYRIVMRLSGFETYESKIFPNGTLIKSMQDIWNNFCSFMETRWNEEAFKKIYNITKPKESDLISSRISAKKSSFGRASNAGKYFDVKISSSQVDSYIKSITTDKAIIAEIKEKAGYTDKTKKDKGWF